MGKIEKLKRIPSNVVSYVQDEGDAIKDEIDKQMILQYAYKRIEFIDWYCELLDVGSKKYIVEQSREELLSIKMQLIKAIDTIENRPLPKRGDILGSIEYPEGYEG